MTAKCQVTLPPPSSSEVLSVQAVLFDLDGTLVNSLPDITAATQGMCEELGLPDVTEAQVSNWIGKGARVLVRSALEYAESLQAGDVLTGGLLNTAFEVFLQHYQKNGSSKTCLLPSARELLDTLRGASIPMALVTNKPRDITLVLLDKLNIAHYFTVVYGGDDFASPKPAPDMLLAAASDLNVLPQYGLMVGDSKNDVLSAQACHMPVVALEGGYNHGEPIRNSRPDAVFDDLSSLLLACNILRV